MAITQTLKRKFARIWNHLDERSRRMLVANEALQEGRGGISRVSLACGLSRVTITKGIREINDTPLPPGRIRRSGGGRTNLQVLDPTLPGVLEALVEPLTRGDPESPLRWTCKSTRILAAELTEQNHPVSHEKVAQFLRGMDYSLQGNRKTEEGKAHPDRDAQFEHINQQVRRALAAGRPVISVDTKKKELIGNYENHGRKWRKTKSPDTVNGHDFPHPSVPRAYPYGIYDLSRNRGFVNVGTDRDTGAFAVASIRGWWHFEGRRLYPKAERLLITADGGGSNGYRLRLWKFELQKLADATKLSIEVCHFPPGTSKWNKGNRNETTRPRDYETSDRLISSTKTSKGLTVSCRLDRRKYPTGRKVTKEEMATIQIVTRTFHGEWNYVIRPR